MQRENLKYKVLSLFENQSYKDELILEIFQYQYANNPLLREYVRLVGAKKNPKSINEITYLPIQLFKKHMIKSGEWQTKHIFESSGTTGMLTSKHHILDLDWYDVLSEKIFNSRFGKLEDFLILGLLPSYLERGNSSLVHMVNSFMEKSKNGIHFYLNDFEALANVLSENKFSDKKIILFGVSFALLDFIQSYQSSMSNLIIIETGGMKGRRKELTREELHKNINAAFPNAEISSEYGMTELLSQAYFDSGWFSVAPSMHINLREITDPLSTESGLKRGAINVVDLGNLDSCAFIATEDIGKKYKGDDQKFNVLGRLDISRLRGCSLLYL